MENPPKNYPKGDNPSLDRYLAAIAKIPLIEKAEEIRLAQRIRQGDKRALDKLVNANLRFVVSVAKEYQHQGVEIADLINEGNIGLIKAAKRFDETRGFKFISYAVWWIRQSILQALAEQSRVVRLPLHKIADLKKVNRAKTDLNNTLGRSPTYEEIAEHTSLKVAEVPLILAFHNTHFSLDSPFSESEDHTLHDVLVDTTAVDPQLAMERAELKKLVASAVNRLTSREAEIMTLYFGLDGHNPFTLEEIGAEYGLTRERVRQIKEKTVRRLQRIANSIKLKEAVRSYRRT